MGSPLSPSWGDEKWENKLFFYRQRGRVPLTFTFSFACTPQRTYFPARCLECKNLAQILLQILTQSFFILFHGKWSIGTERASIPLVSTSLFASKKVHLGTSLQILFFAFQQIILFPLVKKKPVFISQIILYSLFRSARDGPIAL